MAVLQQDLHESHSTAILAAVMSMSASTEHTDTLLTYRRNHPDRGEDKMRLTVTACNTQLASPMPGGAPVCDSRPDASVSAAIWD
eukprot:786967-Ditylum_brightwellii.AAC.1